jgi:hypothetical protein
MMGVKRHFFFIMGVLAQEQIQAHAYNSSYLGG